MKKVLSILLLVGSVSYAQTDVGLDYEKVFCAQPGMQNAQDLLVPIMNRVVTDHTNTTFVLKVINVNCVNGHNVKTNSKGLGVPMFRDVESAWSTNLPEASIKPVSPTTYDITIQIANSVLEMNDVKKFYMTIPFGFSSYNFTITYTKIHSNGTTNPPVPPVPPAPVYSVRLN